MREHRTLAPPRVMMVAGAPRISRARVPCTAKSAMITAFFGSPHHASNSSLGTRRACHTDNIPQQSANNAAAGFRKDTVFGFFFRSMREIYHCLLPGGIISSSTCTAHSGNTVSLLETTNPRRNKYEAATKVSLRF